MSEQHGKSHSHAAHEPKPARNFVFAAIMGLLASYGASALLGWPQHGTEMTNGAHAPPPVVEARIDAGRFDANVAHGKQSFHPPYFMVLPFCLLLAAIAIFPLAHATEHWLEQNLNKF